MSDTQPDAQPSVEGAAEQAENHVKPDSGTDSATGGVQRDQTDQTAHKAGPEKTEMSVEMQLADAQSKAAEYLEGWQRSRAEFANYKKRADREREEVYQVAAADTLRKILPIIDDFDRAVANVPTDKANDDVIKGFSLIHRKLVGLLENSGISVLNPVGEPFNPTLHEAIGQDDSSDVPSGHVSAVLQKGYVFGDKVLRPALVRIAS